MTGRREGSALADLSALRTALGASLRTHPGAAGDLPAFARWENEGGPADTLASQEAHDWTLAASERTWTREHGVAALANAMSGIAHFGSLRRAQGSAERHQRAEKH